VSTKKDSIGDPIPLTTEEGRKVTFNVSEKAAAMEKNDITDTRVLVIQDFLEQMKELSEMQMKKRSLNVGECSAERHDFVISIIILNATI